ncbi:MAG: lysophospholipid acyltransferase family protein [Lentisphaeria bacterium]|nr:lysophospholipid acyltransferase family protein [Lentisphaeria bacterium]
MSPFRYIAGFLIYLSIQLGMLVIGPMNHRILRKFSGLGAMVMYWVPFIRNLCIQNIHAAFPEMSAEQVRETAKGSLRNLALTMCEFLWIRRHPEQFEKIVDVSPSRENAFKARDYAKNGSGAILITPHMGNWEFAGRVLTSSFKVPSGIVVKAARMPFLDQLVSDSRKNENVKIIYSKGAARAMKNALDEGLTVGILIDQNTKVRDGGVFVDFLGLKIPVSRAPAVLARGKNRYVAVGAVIRDSADTAKAYLRELPKPVSEYQSDEEMIQDITDITADYIRMAPEQYLWLYRRFQHIPPDTPEELRKRYPDYARVPKASFFSRSKIRQEKYQS